VEATCIFLPVAVEIVGVLNESASHAVLQGFGSENFTVFRRSFLCKTFAPKITYVKVRVFLIDCQKQTFKKRRSENKTR